MKIKVITLKQPWAHLVVNGDKKIETRVWRTNYRGELYIHASKNFSGYDMELCRLDKHFKNAIPDVNKIVTGAIIGKVKLVDCVETELIKAFPSTGKGNMLIDDELAFGDYSATRFAWILEEAEVLDKPIVTNGRLSIWDFMLVLDDVRKTISHGSR